MSPADEPSANQDHNQNQRLAMTLSYQRPSHVHDDHVALFSNLKRTPVLFVATIKQPLVFREAMAALFAIVSSDYRYVPKDRTAYAAFMLMKRESQKKSILKAQQAYFDWLLKNDTLAYLILDPVITVHPDKVIFEVFSKDEGSYTLLSFKRDFFTDEHAEAHYGTTNINYSDALAQGIEKMRSFRDTRFSVGQEAVVLQNKPQKGGVEEGADGINEVIEKSIQVPTSWLRGFLQVQSAAQIATDSFQMQAIDLYNILHHLRMNADIKGKRRGLAIELVPNEAPRIVLEPWGTVIETTAGVYKGKQSKVVRLWGRRRLALLKRFLPYTDTIEVALLGNGMPSFWTLTGESVSLTLAMTGFTTSNWSQALNFDLLLPRYDVPLAEQEVVINYLQQHYSATVATIAKQLGLTKKAVQMALQQACQQGLVMFDSQQHSYRYRPLIDEPLDLALFQYRHPAEKLAYDLVERQQAVGKLAIQTLPQQGIEVAATIMVKEDKREYLSVLRLNEEGHVAKAECSCHQIMKHGLQQGACSHLIALRIVYSYHLAQRNTAQITHETRAYTRRKKQGEENYQLTLNSKRLLMKWSVANRPRQQQLAFNSAKEARHAYFSKIQQLEKSGFIDMTIG